MKLKKNEWHRMRLKQKLIEEKKLKENAKNSHYCFPSFLGSSATEGLGHSLYSALCCEIYSRRYTKWAIDHGGKMIITKFDSA